MVLMRIKRLFFGLLALSLLSCNFVTRMVFPPTATPVPSPTSTPTATATASPTSTPTPTPLVPAYIPPQCDTSAPLATLSPDTAIEPAPQYETKDISRRMQLQVIDDVEEIVSEVYIYEDFNGLDWTATVARYREETEAGIDTETFYNNMQDLIYELGDDHSSFIPPVGAEMLEAEESGENEFVGVGVFIKTDFERGRIVVYSVLPGSPADYAGLKSHDSILSVDGLPVAVDSGIRTLGPECTAVVLKVQSPGEAPRDVILVRARIVGNPAVEARLVPTTDGSKVGYILIPSFFEESIPGQIEDALREFGDLDGLILDVRGNGGGSLDVGRDVLEFFTKGRMGEFMSREDSSGFTIRANPVHNSQTVPLAVLVDEDSASFSEIFAGLLRDTRGAKIAGQTSLGNVEVLSSYNLEDGSWLWIAAFTFDSAFSEDNWEETGIVADKEAYAPWDTFTFETDPAIAAALELLGRK